MTLANLLVLLLQSGILIGLALLVCALAKSAPAVRVAVCRVTLLALIALCLWRPWMETHASPVVAIDVDRQVFSLQPMVASPPQSDSMAKSSNVIGSPVASVPPEPIHIPFDLVAVWIWAGVSAALTVHLGIGLRGLARIKRHAARIVSGPVVEAVHSRSKLAGIRAPTVVEGPEELGLFVTGMIRPTIFVPRSLWHSENESNLEAVLGHEVTHVANRDLWWGFIRRIVVVALWWQPLIWLLRKPMDTASEELSDRQVLANGTSEVGYADCLLRLHEVSISRCYAGLSIGATSNRSTLAKRIEAILDAGRSRATRLPLWGFGLVFAVGGLAACSAPWLFSRPEPHQVVDGHRLTLDGWIGKPYSCAVQIVDSEGRPVEGASAWIVEFDPTKKTIQVPVSGSTASVDSTLLGDGYSGTLIVHAPKLAVGFERLWPAQSKLGRVVLGPSHSVSGTIMRPDGTLASGVTVSLDTLVRTGNNTFSSAHLDSVSWAGKSVTTGTDGHFTISGVPPGTEVLIDHNSPEYVSIRDQVRYRVPSVGQGRNQEAAIWLRRGATVTGYVTRNGKPVPNVRVGAQGQGGATGFSEAQSDAMGHYVLRALGPGLYNIESDLPKELAARLTTVAHEGVRLSEAGHLDGINFELVTGAEIEGRVVNENNQLVSNVGVGIYGPAHPKSGGWVGVARTDSRGHYIARVPAGRQLVYCQEGETKPAQIYVDVKDGQHLHLDLNVNIAEQDEQMPHTQPQDPMGGIENLTKPATAKRP